MYVVLPRDITNVRTCLEVRLINVSHVFWLNRFLLFNHGINESQYVVKMATNAHARWQSFRGVVVLVRDWTRGNKVLVESWRRWRVREDAWDEANRRRTGICLSLLLCLPLNGNNFHSNTPQFLLTKIKKIQKKNTNRPFYKKYLNGE